MIRSDSRKATEDAFVAAIALLDAQTFVVLPGERPMLAYLRSAHGGPVVRRLAPSVGASAVSLAVNMAAVRLMIGTPTAADLYRIFGKLANFSDEHVWVRASYVWCLKPVELSGSLGVGHESQLMLKAICELESDAQSLEAAAMRILAAVSDLVRQVETDPYLLDRDLAKHLADLVSGTSVRRRGVDTEITVKMRTDRLLSGVAIAANVARSANDAYVQNDLKEMALAFHFYHDKHGRFPPAVVHGRDGKGGPPHSWRVEILPYLHGQDRNAQDLYDAYRFNEPWDSENNKKLLARMPSVFRHPLDSAGSTNASYFAVVGQQTVFSNPKGVCILDIRDGTSNTILLVAAKRTVPWTKPEDIAMPIKFTAQEMAGWRHGGWSREAWNAAMCDGSARLFRNEAVDDKMLEALLSIAGGEPIVFDR